MNLAGVGLPEMAVIFLVAFLVLGPARAIGMARTAGKVLGDLKRTFNEVAAAAASMEQRDQPANRWSSPPESQPQDRGEEPPARFGDARSGDARSGDARSGDARSGDE